MKTFFVLICGLALACTADAQGESKSSQPAPKKKQAHSAQKAVTARGEPQKKVDPRQLMFQSQHDPSTETKKNMKGSQSQQAAGRPETMDKMMRMQHYHDESVTGLKEVGKPRRSTTERELMDTMSGGRRDAKLDKPTFGEKFMMGLKKSTYGHPQVKLHLALRRGRESQRAERK